nr:hypothetical protein Itr_chr08CG07450 [Ipomoea trifida]
MGRVVAIQPLFQLPSLNFIYFTADQPCLFNFGFQLIFIFLHHTCFPFPFIAAGKIGK